MRESQICGCVSFSRLLTLPVLGDLLPRETLTWSLGPQKTKQNKQTNRINVILLFKGPGRNEQKYFENSNHTYKYKLNWLWPHQGIFSTFFKIFFFFDVGHFWSLHWICYNTVSVVYVVVLPPRGMWDPSYPTRDWTHTSALEGKVPTTGPPGKSQRLTNS